jgi:adenosylhomocysteinase
MAKEASIKYAPTMGTIHLMSSGSILNKDFWIKDINLYEEGEKLVRFTKDRMIGLLELEKALAGQEPLKGCRITACVTVTYETAVFILLLRKLGAEVRVCPDNPIGSRDPACAYLVFQGISVFAREGMTESEVYWSFEQAIRFVDQGGNMEGPDIIIDDGCDITRYLHREHPEVYEKLLGTIEQTACGMNEHRKLWRKGGLRTAVIDIDDCMTKKIVDNYSGCRQSLIEGLQQSLNMSFLGKTGVVFGFNFAGQGCALALGGLGMQVIIVEASPFRARDALMQGYRVMSKKEACREADVLVTATGCIKTITGRDFMLLKDGAVLANMGHGKMEIDTEFLNSMPLLGREQVSKYAERFRLPNGKNIYLLCGGRLLNMAIGGHPPES